MAGRYKNAEGYIFCINQPTHCLLIRVSGCCIAFLPLIPWWSQKLARTGIKVFLACFIPAWISGLKVPDARCLSFRWNSDVNMDEKWGSDFIQKRILQNFHFSLNSQEKSNPLEIVQTRRQKNNYIVGTYTYIPELRSAMRKSTQRSLHYTFTLHV